MSEIVKTVDLSDHATLMDCYTKLNETVRALRAELAAEREKRITPSMRQWQEMKKSKEAAYEGYEHLTCERNALRAQLDEACEALEPLGRIADAYEQLVRGEEIDDWLVTTVFLKVGEMRRARAVLEDQGRRE